jgi:hypothetical protein
MEKYPISASNKKKEYNTIHHILQANQYDDKQASHTSNQHQGTDKQETKKRAIFTYIGPQTREITKIFHTTRLKTAFITKHTIRNLLQRRQDWNSFNSCGIYQLECAECDSKYVGQTGISFKTR